MEERDRSIKRSSDVAMSFLGIYTKEIRPNVQR